jgi:nucleoside-diphosphate-sugar epimerase
VIDTGREVGVTTYLIMSPLIYGIGSGFFNKLSIQIPLLTRVAIAQKQAIVIGKGDAVWNHVHIADLVGLYVRFVEKILAGETAALPSNEKGIYFSATGEQTWQEVSEAVAKAGLALGALNTADVKSVSVEEAGKLTGADLQLVELGFASK